MTNQTERSSVVSHAALSNANEPVAGRGLLIAAAILLLVIGLGIFGGIRSRVEAAAKLHATTVASAIPMVEIVHPKSGADGQEVALPGNAQAFNDTPIYARTSGYVEHWYVDIGAHVKQGQLLALIQTPELDQQLEQARADLKTAQANLEIAQITATRWQNLLKTDSVSQQETDQAVSDLNAKRALVDSNHANVERLGTAADIRTNDRAVRGSHHRAQHRYRSPDPGRRPLGAERDFPPGLDPEVACRHSCAGGLRPLRPQW